MTVEASSGTGRGWRGRFDLFAATIAAGLHRLARPVRPGASATMTLFPNWPVRLAALVVGLGLIVASMVYVDPLVQGLRRGWPAQVIGLSALITDLGKSSWVLIPSGVALLAILAVGLPVRRFADKLALALAARLAFVFIAVGGSGLIVTIVKRIIARGRPYYFEQFGALHFQFPSWHSSYASFPSGHSQTIFAAALAFGFLFPRLRGYLIALAVIIAFSRIGVNAHYFTDVVVGGLWGAWFTLMTREWFARRGLVFSPSPSRRPFAMPWRRAAEGTRAVLTRLKP